MAFASSSVAGAGAATGAVTGGGPLTEAPIPAGLARAPVPRPADYLDILETTAETVEDEAEVEEAVRGARSRVEKRLRESRPGERDAAQQNPCVLERGEPGTPRGQRTLHQQGHTVGNDRQVKADQYEGWP